jgi:hypothetical protein
MALGVEVVVDGGMDGKETLGCPGRLETLHFSFSSSDGLVRILSPIVHVLPTFVMLGKTKLAER